MHSTTHTRTVVGVIIVAGLLAVLEQTRIHNSHRPALAFSLREADQTTPVALPARIQCEEGKALLMETEAPSQRRHRVGVRIVLAGFTEGMARFAWQTPAGEKSAWLFPEKLKTEEGRQIFEKVLILEDGQLEATLSGSPGVQLQVEDVVVTSIKTVLPSSSLSGRWPWLAGLLVVAIPLYWLVHSHEVLAQWFLVTVSVTALTLIDPGFAVATVAFVTIIFLLRPLLAAERSGRVTILLTLIGSCIAVLGVLKYAPEWLHAAFFHLGAGSVCLPIGASYFLFRTTDVVLEWYRGNLTEMSFREYLCFMLFLPTIPAGPIESAGEFHTKRLKGFSGAILTEASGRILTGLVKKLLIVSLILDQHLLRPGNGFLDRVSLHPESVGLLTLLGGVICCLLYAYFDLSAYSDLAIGFGLLLGYRVRENFYNPLFKRNIAEFWKAYHASLGEWCTRNVYFPALISTRSTMLAIFASFFVMGIWHHVNLNWTFWALHHAAGILVVSFLADAWFRYYNPETMPRLTRLIQSPWRHAWTGCCVLLTVIYASMGTTFVFVEDISTASQLYLRLWTLGLL